MQVELKVNDWSIQAPTKNEKYPTIVGEYKVMMAGKSIASQSFNSEYGKTKISFSSDLINKIIELEKEIVDEITIMLN